MDFTFNDEQTAVHEAADGIFAGLVDPDRVQEIEASEDRVDRALWAEGPAAGQRWNLRLGIPEPHPGFGPGGSPCASIPLAVALRRTAD